MGADDLLRGCPPNIVNEMGVALRGKRERNVQLERLQPILNFVLGRNCKLSSDPNFHCQTSGR